MTGASHFVSDGFQSTPSPRRATFAAVCLLFLSLISIHALPAEGDCTLTLWAINEEISIHALPAEGDHRDREKGVRPRYFNPRPPRGGRPLYNDKLLAPLYISIHALPAEGDRRADPLHEAVHEFQSTPSPRRATATDKSSAHNQF